MKIIHNLDHKFLLLISRSASHSIATAALQLWYPDKYEEWNNNQSKHPAWYLPNIIYPIHCENPAIIVRNPIERFRSMCAHKPEFTIEYQLNNPIYPPLPSGNFVKYFRFEDQLEECAEWLGLATPIPHIDSSIESDKPILTTQQESIVRQIYADDIALWESLQPSV